MYTIGYVHKLYAIVPPSSQTSAYLRLQTPTPPPPSSQNPYIVNIIPEQSSAVLTYRLPLKKDSYGYTSNAILILDPQAATDAIATDMCRRQQTRSLRLAIGILIGNRVVEDLIIKMVG